MLRWLLGRKLDSEEKRLGESMDYLRHVLGTSQVAFLRFASTMPFANSRNVLSKEAWYTAQMVSLQQEDCGPCLQIAVNLAQQDQVDPSIIRAVLAKDSSRLSQELSDVYEFVTSIVSPNIDDNDALREVLRNRHGERGLIELSYAIASSRIPPTVKRVLGYAKTCKNVTIITEAIHANKNA